MTILDALEWSKKSPFGLMPIDVENEERVARAPQHYDVAWQMPPPSHPEVIKAIKTQLIPHPVDAHRTVTTASPPVVAFTPEHIADCARMAIAANAETLAEYIEKICQTGIEVERIYLELLAPVALCLGTWWDEDEISFTTVTIGLVRLHHVLHLLSFDFMAEHQGNLADRRILIASAPGEQHLFGSVMVTEFLQREGWIVAYEPALNEAGLLHLLKTEWFSIVGFSLFCSDRFDRLAKLIGQIRTASCNPDLSIMVGGPVFATNPEMVARIGADATARDGKEAAHNAQLLIERKVGRQKAS